MILFHGTLEENIKSIKKNGLLANTKDQWLLEVVEKPVCCTSKNPVSGEGGNPSYFAYGSIKSKNQDGYLVVLDVPKDVLSSKIIAIFDNKTLDDYVRFHFFIRHEFRLIGRNLLLAMSKHREKDYYWRQLDKKISKRPAKPEDIMLLQPQEQHEYYKKLKDERYMYDFLGWKMSDEMYDFFQLLGKWQTLYEFLDLYYAKIDTEKWENFEKTAPHNNAEYWKSFYRCFLPEVSDPKLQSLSRWFSPEWLSSRKLQDFNENCQILSTSLGPEYIKGFIKITTPSGFAQPFRAHRSKSSFSQAIWKEVHSLLDEKR